MRVILSRKGFDSGYGGVPSPILPDGRMISLPIPDKDAPVTYSAIHRCGYNVGDFVSELSQGRVRRDYRAHLDPDLDSSSVPRPGGWRPAFGQSGAALGHLRKNGIGPGDLFLFFGWFRAVEQVAGRWRYARRSSTVHALWGWLSIGAVHACHTLPPDVRERQAGHPHLSGVQPRENALFIAADHLSIAGQQYSGAGLFASRRECTLTLPGASPSVWRVPSWMNPRAGVASLSYHADQARWTSNDGETCCLASVAKGQEFVLSTERADLLTAWLSGIFEGADRQSFC